MAYTSIPTCFVCHQQVLGLMGQDFFLDTFYLHSEKEDREAVAEKAFGECHLRCLIDSRWGSFWAKRIVENLRDVRRYYVLFSNDKLSMLQDRVLGDTTIVQTDGWFVTVDDQTLLTSTPTEADYFLPVHQDINIPLSQHTSLIEDVEQRLTAGKSFPLPEFIDRLGITDRLLYPEAIKGGTMHAANDSKPIIHDSSDIGLTAVLSYSKYLPKYIAHTLIDCLHHPAS